MSDPIETFRDEDFTAVEYVLGTLTAGERLAAERRMRREAPFRAEVEAWQMRLGPLARAASAVPPPAGLWEAIDAALPATGDARAAALPAREGLVPAFWRRLALGSGALAAASLAALAVLVVQPVGEPVPGTPAGLQLAAAIESDDGLPIFAVVVDPSDDSAILVPIRLEAGPGQVPELWLVREGGAPESLGVVRADEPLRIQTPGGVLAGDLAGGVLAISLEPEGGSPTGQPTGPVVGHGDLRSI